MVGVGKTDPIERGLRLFRALIVERDYVGKTDPIERGLRLVIPVDQGIPISWKNRPDRKGIKTHRNRYALQCLSLEKQTR